MMEHYYRYRLKYEYEIIAFCDNNQDKIGKSYHGIPVVSVNDLWNYQEKIIICTSFYQQIGEQLVGLGIKNSLYYVSQLSKMILPYNQYQFFHACRKIKRVLFVQTVQCMRTYKIASAIHEKGVRVDLAYTAANPYAVSPDWIMPYENIIAIDEISTFLNRVNDEDYDIVHCSNEPDTLCTLLLNSNKPVVHDTHDMMSLRGDISFEHLVDEYTATVKSAGNMYVTEKIKEIAVKKYGVGYKNTFVVNNYILNNQKPTYFLPKLSMQDGEIHCVYEGGVGKDENTHRYYEVMWKKLAEKKIHVHFYAYYTREEDYYFELDKMSPYIHYEGHKNPQELMTLLTQYDVGLVLLNITPREEVFLQTTFPNKIFEYLNAAIPVAVSNIESLKEFAEQYGVGKYLDFSGDIKGVVEEIAKIKIDRDFLVKNNLTMNSKANEIIDFYSAVKMQYDKTH